MQRTIEKLHEWRINEQQVGIDCIVTRQRETMFFTVEDRDREKEEFVGTKGGRPMESMDEESGAKEV